MVPEKVRGVGNYEVSIRAAFAENELGELASCRHEVNEFRSFGTLDLLVSWALHVDKIDTDRFRSADDRRVWGGYDLVAAMSMRDFLAGCIDRLPEPLRAKVIAVADTYDQRFLAVTVADDDGLMRRFTDGELSSAPWWWHRIPDRGPTFEELMK